jgi:hypothetical protein
MPIHPPAEPPSPKAAVVPVVPHPYAVFRWTNAKHECSIPLLYRNGKGPALLRKPREGLAQSRDSESRESESRESESRDSESRESEW